MLHRKGAHVLVDGQFGSTGKGLLAAFMAEKYGSEVDVVVTNAGPNSGHTCYIEGEKIVLKQLPTFPVALRALGRAAPPTFISPGAVIDPEILNREAEKWKVPVFLHSKAALIRPEDKEAELTGSVAAVAGTRQGVGVALANKVLRDETAAVQDWNGRWHESIRIMDHFPDWKHASIFAEVSQGFSLGLNSQFYPKVTSRECTVMQALSDARIHPVHYEQCMMVIRTFPIRVGNVDGYDSGAWYPDQKETTWDTVGVDAETTTVTGRIRRVATFSELQFKEALLANRPRTILLNFMNYIPEGKRAEFASRLKHLAKLVLGEPVTFLYGHGPMNEDISDNPESSEWRK